MLKRISLEEAQNFQRILPGEHKEKKSEFFTLTPLEDGWEKVTYYSLKPHRILKEGNNKGNAYVYIISNPSMPGMVKIGFTTRKDPKQRIQELNKSSSVPTPFNIEYLYQYYGGSDFEKAIHKELAGYRVSTDREFFYMDVVDAIEYVKDIAGKNQNIR